MLVLLLKHAVLVRGTAYFSIVLSAGGGYGKISAVHDSAAAASAVLRVVLVGKLYVRNLFDVLNLCPHYAEDTPLMRREIRFLSIAVSVKMNDC